MIMNSENKTFVALGSSIVLGLALLICLGYRRFYCRKKLGKRAVVKSLYLYPVKSCAGIKLDKVEVEEVGLLLDRCPTVAVDPDSGIMKNDGEPLETLKRTHVGVLDKRLANKPLFGVYFITDQSGSVLVGDAVNVLA